MSCETQSLSNMSHRQALRTQPQVAELAQSATRTLAIRPVPGRRKENSCRHQASRVTQPVVYLVNNIGIFTVIILSLLALSSGVAADQHQRSAVIRPSRRSGLLVDPRPSPPPLNLDYLEYHEEAKRQVRTVSSSSISSSPSSTHASSTTSYAAIVFNSAASNASGTSAPTGLATENSPKATGLPQVFDSNLGVNFTNPSCPSFFSKLKFDNSFQTCYPFSLLLTNSMSFFQAEKSFFTATYALDASCSVDYPRCTALMSSLAQQLRADDVCGQDLSAENPLVQNTYNGLISFPTLYQAGCLKDQKGNYCFATAVTNQTTASDVYPYYLPLGTPLPVNVRPTCSTCLKNTMGIFANAASNSTQPVSKTYKNAAQQINTKCSANWVPESVRAGTSAAGKVGVGLWAVAAGFIGVLLL